FPPPRFSDLRLDKASLVTSSLRFRLAVEGSPLPTSPLPAGRNKAEARQATIEPLTNRPTENDRTSPPALRNNHSSTRLARSSRDYRPLCSAGSAEAIPY